MAPVNQTPGVEQGLHKNLCYSILALTALHSGSSVRRSVTFDVARQRSASRSQEAFSLTAC